MQILQPYIRNNNDCFKSYFGKALNIQGKELTELHDVMLFKCQDINVNKQTFYSPLLLLHERQRNGKSHAAAVFNDKA
jgi:hypothetical protein